MKCTILAKSELAHMFLPHIELRSAVNRLMIWIKRNKELSERLRETGYYPTQKYFTPRQVELIIEYLGEPG